jgi:O-antigen/teichoic acid export membrane protein
MAGRQPPLSIGAEAVWALAAGWLPARQTDFAAISGMPMSAIDNSGLETAQTAQLAKGGRTSFVGYLLRLAGRIPFLFIAGRLYGADALGRFAYAIMIVELVAMFATLGLKRGLAEDMALRLANAPAGQDRNVEAHSFYDALLISFVAAVLGAGLLVLLPQTVFPTSELTPFERLFPLVVMPIVVSDVCLAALAFRLDIVATVRARAVIEPWVLSIASLALAYTVFKPDGLMIAYVVSLVAAAAASLLPAARSFGFAPGWRPHPATLLRLIWKNLPLSGADIALWGGRRLDIFILGRLASPEVVGIYYMAQQFASLPQRINSSFDAILAPVLATNLAAGNLGKVAGHLRQIGFWIAAAQLGVVLALACTGRAGMGLFGPVFASGALVLSVLLAVELLAAQAAVSESALIYMARGWNLLWSLVGIGIQAGVSIVLIPRTDWLGGGVGAAGGLAVSALFLSVIKTRLLSAKLGQPVSGWRWSLLAAGAAGLATGLLVMRAPEPIQLSIGIVAILGVYGSVMWRWGFKGADRLLFARRLKKLEAEAGLADQPS